MLKGVIQRYAPNIMMTKLEKTSIGDLSRRAGDNIHGGRITARQRLPEPYAVLPKGHGGIVVSTPPSPLLIVYSLPR